MTPPNTTTTPETDRAEPVRQYPIEDYDPDASSAIKTLCPGCNTEIIIFQSGQITEPRDEPLPPGELPGGLINAAFVPHYCPANDREWVCHNCHTRYPDEDAAEDCCRIDNPRAGASLVANYDPEQHD